MKDALIAAREQLRLDAENPALSSKQRADRSRELLIGLRRMELEAQERRKPHGTEEDF